MIITLSPVIRVALKNNPFVLCWLSRAHPAWPCSVPSFALEAAVLQVRHRSRSRGLALSLKDANTGRRHAGMCLNEGNPGLLYETPFGQLAPRGKRADRTGMAKHSGAREKSMPSLRVVPSCPNNGLCRGRGRQLIVLVLGCRAKIGRCHWSYCVLSPASVVALFDRLRAGSYLGSVTGGTGR